MNVFVSEPVKAVHVCVFIFMLLPERRGQRGGDGLGGGGRTGSGDSFVFKGVSLLG